MRRYDYGILQSLNVLVDIIVYVHLGMLALILWVTTLHQLIKIRQLLCMLPIVLLLFGCLLDTLVMSIVLVGIQMVCYLVQVRYNRMIINIIMIC